ncbi:AAA family ATPase [Maribacter sp. R77961]|uniref:AAA family ATPase n=1 Tax=Maribacter sp. R77961 TaxID=3093871 RepID=UPI0037C58460
MEKEKSKKEWERAIKKALEFYENNDWENDDTIKHVLYKGKKIPPKEVYRKAEEFFIIKNPNANLPMPGGGKPINKFIEKHGFPVIEGNTPVNSPKICKMQMKANSDGKNYADEVLSDNRITGHIDYVREKFENLNKGDIVLVHKGKHPHCLVKIDFKILDKTQLIGESFGIDYKVIKLGYYSDIPNTVDFKSNFKGLGPEGSFAILVDTTTKTYQFILSWLNYLNPQSNMEKYIQLLKYKKQIILQGPPGTGKTWLAKQLAETLISENSEENTAKSLNESNYSIISENDINSILKKGVVVTTPSKRKNYIVEENDVKNKKIVVQRESSTTDSTSYKDIASAAENQLWNQKLNQNNLRRAAALAKYIIEYKSKNHQSVLQRNKTYEIVQFHPSYTYEDFVRGIKAKSEGEHISYETENEILAILAEKANNNLIASKKDVQEFSIEESIKDLLVEFSETIQDKIDELEEYKITEAVSIVAVEDDAFRYTGKWKTSQRMKFKDLVTSILENVSSRQDLKKLDNVSGLAKQHATYFFKVLELFKKDFKQQLSSVSNKTLEKPQRKNYVLIIDEINRANLPSVLGELIYALEYRGEPVSSIYSIDNSATITIPENLYIIGTMNTADRSVGHIDYAIKRRFAFVDMLPKAEVIVKHKARELFNLVSELFTETFLASDFEAKDVHLGHSYFLISEESDLSESEQLQLKLDYEILPILNEYVKDGLLLESSKEKIKQIANFEC